MRYTLCTEISYPDTFGCERMNDRVIKTYTSHDDAVDAFYKPMDGCRYFKQLSTDDDVLLSRCNKWTRCHPRYKVERERSDYDAHGNVTFSVRTRYYFDTLEEAKVSFEQLLSKKIKKYDTRTTCVHIGLYDSEETRALDYATN